MLRLLFLPVSWCLIVYHEHPQRKENTVLHGPAQRPWQAFSSAVKTNCCAFREVSSAGRPSPYLQPWSFSMLNGISNRAGLIFQVLKVPEKICKIQLFTVRCKFIFLSLPNYVRNHGLAPPCMALCCRKLQ